MRAETLYDGITQVADDLVEQAAVPCVSVKKPRWWVQAAGAAAACAVLLLTVPRFVEVGGSNDAASPEAAEPGAPPAMDAPAELPIPAPEEPNGSDTPSAGGIYTADGVSIGLEERYWHAMDNCVAIWRHKTGFSQAVLEGVSVSVLSDAARSNVTLADGSEIDSETWDAFIDVISVLDPAVEYWDFAFPNGVHAIMDSRNGQMVGYILP